jgi:preprotein translocase subunit SecG
MVSFAMIIILIILILIVVTSILDQSHEGDDGGKKRLVLKHHLSESQKSVAVVSGLLADFRINIAARLKLFI